MLRYEDLTLEDDILTFVREYSEDRDFTELKAKLRRSIIMLDNTASSVRLEAGVIGLGGRLVEVLSKQYNYKELSRLVQAVESNDIEVNIELEDVRAVLHLLNIMSAVHLIRDVYHGRLTSLPESNIQLLFYSFVINDAVEYELLRIYNTLTCTYALGSVIQGLGLPVNLMMLDELNTRLLSFHNYTALADELNVIRFEVADSALYNYKGDKTEAHYLSLRNEFISTCSELIVTKLYDIEAAKKQIVECGKVTRELVRNGHTVLETYLEDLRKVRELIFEDKLTLSQERINQLRCMPEYDPSIIKEIIN